MKKIIFITILITALIPPVFILANGDHNLSLEDVLGEIMSSQNVNKVSEIDCLKVTDEQFEKLGDAVMGVMHPDEKEHESMDQMMGGEGSESVKAMHILMGKRYLGCGGEMSGMMDMMMPGGMMGGGNNTMGEMMGWNNWRLSSGWAWLGWIFMILILVWIVLGVLGIIVLVKWIIKK